MNNNRITILYWDEGAQGSTQIGGGQRLLFSIARGLDKSKFRPILLTSCDDELANKWRKGGLEVAIIELVSDIQRISRYRLGKSFTSSLSFYMKARRIGRYIAHFCELNNVDILHPNENLTRTISSLSADRFQNTKLVTHIDNIYTRSYIDKFLKKLYKRFELLISVSDAAGSPFKSSRTIYPGIDLNPLLQIKQTKSYKLRVSIIAKLIEFKGQRSLLHAVANLSDEHRKRIVVNIVGSGPDENLLRDYATHLGLDESVEFHGQVENMNQIYSNSDVIVQASATEAFPLVLLEAGAAGLPVIATNVGGTREIVIHNATGVIIPQGNINALTVAMQRFLDSPDNAIQLGKNAREVIRTSFDVGTCIEKHETIYEELLKN